MWSTEFAPIRGTALLPAGFTETHTHTQCSSGSPPVTTGWSTTEAMCSRCLSDLRSSDDGPSSSSCRALNDVCLAHVTVICRTSEQQQQNDALVSQVR